MLRYFGFFREPVPDSPLEAWRVRKVELLYYLEDGKRPDGCPGGTARAGFMCHGATPSVCPSLPPRPQAACR